MLYLQRGFKKEFPMNPVLVYVAKCVLALFAMFLVAGSIGMLLLGDKPIAEENITAIVKFGMLAGAGLGAFWFWPRWPRA